MEGILILNIVIGLLVFGIFFGCGVLFNKKGYQLLDRWVRKTKWRADDIIIPVLRTHIFVWFFLMGIYFGVLIGFSSTGVGYVSKFIIVCFLISLTIAFSRIVAGLIRVYSDRLRTTIAVSGLTQTISKSVIFVVGGLMVLNTLGISITPIITTLGVGGLAVALALQDTLSNFFAGFHIILAKQIKIGDYIKLDTGEEGYVEDISWRSTKIRMLPNNIVLVPNSKLSQIIVTNYYLPKKEMSILVDVGVHYESDLDKVEKITLEVARDVLKDFKDKIPDFEPFIRFHTFGDFSINFTVYLRAEEFFAGYRVKHEFIKRLHKRYNQENINIPFPITALNMDQEKSSDYFNKQS